MQKTDNVKNKNWKIIADENQNGWCQKEGMVATSIDVDNILKKGQEKHKREKQTLRWLQKVEETLILTCRKIKETR